MKSRRSPGGYEVAGDIGGGVNSVSTQQLVHMPHPLGGVDLQLPSRWGGAQPMSMCKTRQWTGGFTRPVFGVLTDCELMGANAKKVSACVCVCVRLCVRACVWGRGHSCIREACEFF